jgi:hypothetical protein
MMKRVLTVAAAVSALAFVCVPTSALAKDVQKAAAGGGAAVIKNTKLTASTPADKSTVQGSPKEISLTFPHPMKLDALTVTHAVKGAKPMAVDVGTQAVGERATVAAPTLKPGAYHVMWKASGADGHKMEGTFGFTVK